jgi:hypothetical protein
MLMPYKYAKRGSVPERIYIESELYIPHPDPRTILQSNENILYLSRAKASGQIDLVWGESLIADQCRVRDGLIDDAKLITAGRDSGPQVITFTGGGSPGSTVLSPDGVGLAQLPGTNIDMRDTAYGEWKANGHDPGVIESTATESVDHDSKPADPGP